MFSACGDENQVARMEGVSFFAVLENAPPADDDIYFVLRMRLLWIVPHGLVNFYRQMVAPVEFEEGFTFVRVERFERFCDTDFHSQYDF